MCACDDYPPSVFREKEVTARKEHKCCECEAAINPGDKYQNIFGVWDGNSETFKTCLKCAARRDELTKEAKKYGDCGPCLSELQQYERDLEMYAAGQMS